MRTQLGALWDVDRFRRSASTLEKYQCALRFADLPKFSEGALPYQDTKLLIDLRNALVHFVPETTPTKSGPSIEIPKHKFENMLKGKFAPNPFAAKYSIISTSSSP